jgi:hypothetical protein
MRWQTTAALAIVLIALGAFFYVYEIRQGPEREKTESRKGRVWTTLDTPDVQELTIERPSDVVKIKRDGDGWQIVEPVKSRGDRGKVEDVLTTIVTARSDREIVAAPGSVAEFGLDKPAAKISMKLKNGKELGLTLGAKSPTGVWVYAREKDKPAVVAVGDSVLRDATSPVADFRDKTLLTFARRDVTGVDIVTRDDTMTIEGADGKWRLTRPVALAADTETMTEFLDKLSAGKIKEFVTDAPRSLETYGLDRPLRVEIHTGKDKDRATKTVAFGRVDGEKKGVYAMRPGEPTVLLVPEDVWAAVPKTVATARNKSVIDFDRDKVAQIEVESPKGRVTLARDKGTWKITAPETLPADQTEAGAILFKLRDLKAQGFLSEDASGIGRFLAKPEVRVSITEEGATPPKTLLIAPSPERRGGQPSAYAAIAGRGPVVLVDARVISDLSRSVNDVRDRTLVSGLEPKDVKRMRVKAAGKSVLVERRDSEWTVLEPKKGAAKSTKVEDLLYALRGLKWKDIAAAHGEEPAKYGLASPAMEIVLYRADGTEITTVLVGKKDGDREYVKTKAAPIYTIDPKQLGELPKVPEDFQS